MGKPELFLMPWTGNGPVQLTSNGCTNESPTWSPDGRTLYWANDCAGNFEIYKADLVYRYESSYGIDAGLTNITRLTNSPDADRYPRVSPDGTAIAFTSDREGQEEIYVINSSNGTGERRLTTNNADDNAPSWRADSQALVFASNRTGNWDIFTMDLTGNNVTQLTTVSSDERWALWAQ
jgi:Tol biopolymer transport system component